MFGFILDELLTVVESLVRNHHAWTADLTQEDALDKVKNLREKLTVNNAEENENDADA
jgi:hypothetical protein